MAEILRLSDRPSSLEEAWRVAELYGEIKVDDGHYGGPGRFRYQVRIYGRTPAGSSIWATGYGDDIMTALCKAVEEAHGHGVEPR